jgi:glutamate-5-semialdehyde dehydrogenase
MTDIAGYAESLGKTARKAAGALSAARGAVKIDALHRIAAAIRENAAALIEANALDVAEASRNQLGAALVERLKLNPKRVESMAAAVDQIADQVDPVGQTIEASVRPNGLRVEKRRVPLGVVLFFYESRPNVTSDAAALCIKSGNAVILRGGKESLHSNTAIAKLIRGALEHSGLPPGAVQLVESIDRTLVTALLKLDKFIDVAIPRGGESLIRAVTAEARMPVLKHFTGNCHLYIDASARDMQRQVRQICVNAKTSYPGGAVCNAVEHILFHRDIADALVPLVAGDLSEKGVEIRADARSRELFPSAAPAGEADWDTEYLSLVVGMKVVNSLEEAIDHINEHGSHHTDGIIAASTQAIERFVVGVDSASVMVNASTRFADGGEYGLGAEIGISTDKLHARGPMGAADLTTYKWVVTGDGHVRQ